MHQHTGEVPVPQQVLKYIQHLSMQQRRLREFARCGGPGQHEDAGTNDGANAQRGE